VADKFNSHPHTVFSNVVQNTDLGPFSLESELCD